MKITKITALLLAVLMVLSLTGCGGDTGAINDLPVVPLSMTVEEPAGSENLYEDVTVERYNYTVRLIANVDLTQVQLVSLDPDTAQPGEVLYALPTLAAGKDWYVRTYVNDAVPTRGIVCTDAQGKTHRYALAWSGQEGDVYLKMLPDQA